jgi:hypothetical protein
MNTKLKKIMEQYSIPERGHMRVVCRKDTKNKTWVFVGYICSSCEKMLKTQNVAVQHVCIPSLARKTIREPVNPDVRTVSGKPYKPF